MGSEWRKISSIEPILQGAGKCEGDDTMSDQETSHVLAGLDKAAQLGHGHPLLVVIATATAAAAATVTPAPTVAAATAIPTCAASTAVCEEHRGGGGG